MAPKRDYSDVDDGQLTDSDSASDGGPRPKRARKRTGARRFHFHQHAATDPTWGQKYVFSNSGSQSTVPYGEESEYEDDADAMAYLRSVRCARRPHPAVSPRPYALTLTRVATGSRRRASLTCSWRPRVP